MKLSEIELPQNRNFGLFFAVVFAFACGYFFNDSVKISAWVSGTLAVAFAVIALTKSKLLLPLNKLWMRFGLLLGMILSPIVLGLIFFSIFTPIGFLMRITGRDELRLKTQNAESYWKMREPSRPSAKPFKNQF